MNKLVLSLFTAIAAIAAAAAPAAAVPTEVSFAGRLADADGAPVEGPVDLGFRLYDGATVPPAGAVLQRRSSRAQGRSRSLRRQSKNGRSER